MERGGSLCPGNGAYNRSIYLICETQGTRHPAKMTNVLERFLKKEEEYKAKTISTVFLIVTVAT